MFVSGRSYSRNIFDRVSQEDIACYYFGAVTLPSCIRSPYRKDNRPSCSLFYYRDKLMFKDFASGDSGSIIDLMMKTYDYTFREAIERIDRDFPQIKKSGNTVYANAEKKRKAEIYFKSLLDGEPVVPKKTTRPRVNVSIVPRGWLDHDIEYWKQYGISIDTLKRCDVHAIGWYTIKSMVFKADRYAYAYIEDKDGIRTYKIYQPYLAERKWFNNHNSSVWDLWRQAMESNSDTLIITSSRKDAMCIMENLGFAAVCMQGEGYNPKKHIIEQLKAKFEHIYVLYDNDYNKEVNVGHINAEKICKRHDLDMIEIPVWYQSKDPSDLCKEWGRDTLVSVINREINICKKRK